MTTAPGECTRSQRWLHRWAVFTVCATFVLLFLGSVVTTFKVGMADPIWPTAPWHLFVVSWDEPSAGFLIEHSHRLAGYIVGCCVIVLALGLWRVEPRMWVRRLGWIALIGVILQGVLGGLRVKLDAWLGMGTALALVHGCFAQLVFALLAALALVTSPRWICGCAAPADRHARQIRRWASVTVGLLYAQIVLGAVLRHTLSPLGPRGHLVLAFAAVAAVVWLLKLALEDNERTIVGPAILLCTLTALQVMVGVEAWLLRFAEGMHLELPPQITVAQAAVRTAHVLTGFAILATAVVAALRSRRLLAEKAMLPAFAERRLEGAL